MNDAVRERGKGAQDVVMRKICRSHFPHSRYIGARGGASARVYAFFSALSNAAQVPNAGGGSQVGGVSTSAGAPPPLSQQQQPSFAGSASAYAQHQQPPSHFYIRQPQQRVAQTQVSVEQRDLAICTCRVIYLNSAYATRVRAQLHSNKVDGVK